MNAHWTSKGWMEVVHTHKQLSFQFAVWEGNLHIGTCNRNLPKLLFLCDGTCLLRTAVKDCEDPSDT